MKSESLVIVNHNVTVNDLSNFAHTAHHARRVVTAGNFIRNSKGRSAPSELICSQRASCLIFMIEERGLGHIF